MDFRMFVLTIFLNFVAVVVSIPQVFTDDASHTTCKYKFPSKKSPITFSSKTWLINTREFAFNLSLCAKERVLYDKFSETTVYFKGDFVAMEDFTLTSPSTTKCLSDPSKNYSLTIALACADSIKLKPRLLFLEDDCVFEVTMMRPDCRPRCTELINDSFLLDIRNFRNVIQVVGSNSNASHRFSLALCGSNNDCAFGIGACELKDNSTMAIATVESQHLNYDLGKNELTARGKVKDGKVVRDMQVLIKCRWETDLANPKKPPVQTQGRHYRFELESSYGCVKLPQNCLVMSIHNFRYDLSKLNKEWGWEIKGIPEGRIFINVCGSLREFGGVCTDQYSQVCHIKDNTFINRGSIMSSLQVTDDVIRGTFVSGSTCVEDPRVSYSTHVEYHCSNIEKGPVLQRQDNCTTFVVWETPHACPLDLYKGPNCYINDHFSNRNLQKLYSDDKTYSLSSDDHTKIVYNLCGPIHQTCNNFTNVSFCLKMNDKELPIGWDNRDLISENGLIRLELQGSMCSGGKPSEVIVNFVCSYTHPSPPTQITVIEDGCRYNVIVFAEAACASHATFQNCSFTKGNLTYDLTALSLRDSNHVIKRDEISFVFNLCGPIVTTSDATCVGDVMFCRRNETEYNFKHRYTSLGGVTSPRLLNNRLVVEAKMGGFCPDLGFYKSVLNLECAKERSSPTFVSNVDCVYNFEWKTPEACPQERVCVLQTGNSDVRLDLTHVENKTVTINTNHGIDKYHFHLCTDVYVKSTNGMKVTKFLKRQFFVNENSSYLVLDLGVPCSNSISKIVFQLECSSAGFELRETSLEDCVLNVTMRTKVCLSELPTISHSIVRPTISPEIVIDRIITENRSLAMQKTINATKVAQQSVVCTISNPYTGYEFNLSQIPNEEITFQKANYQTNFLSSDRCGGILCINNEIIVTHMCPRINFNYASDSVHLIYVSESVCQSTDLKTINIELKCNYTKSGGSILQDDECASQITYNLPEACFLLQQNIVSGGHTAVIAGSMSTVLVILCIVIILYLNRKKCREFKYMPFQRNKSETAIYKRNCSL